MLFSKANQTCLGSSRDPWYVYMVATRRGLQIEFRGFRLSREHESGQCSSPPRHGLVIRESRCGAHWEWQRKQNIIRFLKHTFAEFSRQCRLTVLDTEASLLCADPK